MRKVIIWFVGVIVVLFAAGFIAWNILPSYLASKLSGMAKVDVSINRIGIYPSSVSVQKIRVGNPRGSILSDALRVQTINADVPFTHFFDQQIVIPEMEVNKIYLGLEFDKKGSKQGNWTTIMNNLNQSMGDEKPKDEKRMVIIKKLILKDIDISLVFRDEGKVHRLDTVKRLEFKNVTSEGGIPTAQITNLIISHMLKEVFSLKNLQNMIEGIIKNPTEGVFDTLKGIFSQKIVRDKIYARLEEVFLKDLIAPRFIVHAAVLDKPLERFPRIAGIIS